MKTRKVLFFLLMKDFLHAVYATIPRHNTKVILADA
jgi:hypothetical protein